MSYLTNSWYMAAWSDEVSGSAPLARTLLDDPVVVFRDGAGKASILFDRCPHRFAALSRGKVQDGAIACGYHGLKFAGDGACVENPHGAVTRSLRVKSYPVVEAHRAIWFWPGDPSLADASKLRDLSFLSETPETAFSKGYVHGQGHYQLFVDNVLDLTHADFLHPQTLGGGSYTRTRAQVSETDGLITVLWDCLDEVPMPLLRSRFPASVDAVDAWTEVIWSAPGVMSLRTGAVPAGASREAAAESVNVHIMTPETAKTTHYFDASTRNYAVEDVALNDAIMRVRDEIFATEDEPTIRAQQERMGDAEFWSLRPVLLRIDEGAVKVRRHMEGLIAAEQDGARASAKSAIRP